MSLFYVVMGSMFFVLSIVGFDSTAFWPALILANVYFVGSVIMKQLENLK